MEAHLARHVVLAVHKVVLLDQVLVVSCILPHCRHFRRDLVDLINSDQAIRLIVVEIGRARQLLLRRNLVSVQRVAFLNEIECFVRLNH